MVYSISATDPWHIQQVRWYTPCWPSACSRRVCSSRHDNTSSQTHLLQKATHIQTSCLRNKLWIGRNKNETGQHVFKMYSSNLSDSGFNQRINQSIKSHFYNANISQTNRRCICVVAETSQGLRCSLRCRTVWSPVACVGMNWRAEPSGSQMTASSRLKER